MEDAISHIRPYFELIYFVSGPFIALAAIYGLNQLRIMKQDMRLRNERAAKEKAIEACREYEVYASLYNAFSSEREAKNISTYTGPLGDFSPDSIPADRIPMIQKLFDEPGSLTAVLNKLESVAATFVSGVADEEIGYGIIGRSFCHNVESLYDIISACRVDSASPYLGTITSLYRIWASRLSKAELTASKNAIDARLKDIPDLRIPPIGPQNL